MREPPGGLTERVLQMLVAACASAMTLADVIEQLTASLRRTVTYLARRERLHRQTAYDEVLERGFARSPQELLQRFWMPPCCRYRTATGSRSKGE